MAYQVADPRVYGGPEYTDNLFDTDVYGEWTEEEGFSATDTVVTTDSIARLLSLTRTLTDTTSVSDAVAGVTGSEFYQSADPRVYGSPDYSDNLADTDVYGEWATDTSSGTTATDSTSVSDSVSRAAIVHARTATDTTGVSESVNGTVGGGTLFTRTASDTTSVSDSASRAAISHARTSTDTTSLSDAVSRAAISHHRTTTDTTTVSDAANRAAMTFNRVTVDTVGAFDLLVFAAIAPVASFTADIVSGEEPLRVQFVDTTSYAPTSWAWDFGDGTASLEQNPYHLFAAGTYTVTLVATNAAGDDTVTQTDLIVTSPLAVPINLLPAMDVTIRVNGVEVCQDVRWKDAIFSNAVNGMVGRCQIAVRDRGHDYGFTTGQLIELEIAGILYWSGFVEIVHRSYSFDVDDTTNAQTVARWFIIEGYDVNLLLQRRVAWNIPHPTRNLTPPPDQATKDPNLWREGGSSKRVVQYVLETYTLLPDDGVTFNEIVDIGSPNPDTMDAHGGGISVATFMQQVNSLLNGIFYLRPNRSFVFRDVEVATSPFVITDKPDGPYDVGPRDYSILSDATKMQNDALVWGTAKGINHITFARSEAGASQSEHGRWQVGEFTPTLYRQASVTHRASSMVFGNNPTRHGPKDDRVYAEATVYRPIFQLGDVVRCEQQVYDGTQTEPFNTGEDFVATNLPVRAMEISFPSPNHPQFKLVLSQEIDDPWNTFEFAPFPPFGGGLPTLPVLPIIPIHEHLPPPPGECTDAICGITDFGLVRSTVGDFDTADSGLVWRQYNGTDPGLTAGVTYDRVNGVGVIETVDVDIEYGSIDLELPVSDFEAVFKVTDYTTDDTLGFVDFTSPGAGSANYVKMRPSTDEFSVQDYGIAGETVTFTFDGSPFWVRVQRDGAGTRARIWYDSDPEPSYWMASAELVGSRTGVDCFGIEADSADNNGTTWSISELSIYEKTADNGTADVWSNFTGYRVLQGSGFGGGTSINAEDLDAGGGTVGWASGGDGHLPETTNGKYEVEYRLWKTYLLPPGSGSAQIQGIVQSQLVHQMEASDRTGTPVGFDSAYTIYSGAWDPDTGPTDFDALGAVIASGAVPASSDQLDAGSLLGDPFGITISSSLLGAVYDPGDHLDWRLFQIILVCTSTEGLGYRTTLTAPGETDGSRWETDARFPSNPNWHFGAGLDYVDYSYVTNGVHFDINDGAVSYVAPSPLSLINRCSLNTGDGCYQDCPDVPDCSVELLTETNLSSDWITLSEIGRWDVDGNLLRVHYDSAVDPMGSGATIKRTLTLPAAVVEAGLRLDAKFGYTSTLEAPGGTPPFFKTGFMGASIKIVGGSQDFTSGEGNSDSFAFGDPYGAFIAFPGAGVGHTVELGPYDWVQGVDQTISLILSPTERTAKLLEQGYSVTETHAPTYPSPFGSPPMYDVTITLYGNAASDGFVPPPDGVIEDWIGIPILMDLAGQPLDIPGVQECVGCAPVFAPGGGYYGDHCETPTRVDATHYTTSSRIVSGSTQVWVNGYQLLVGGARDYTITLPNTIVFNDSIDPAAAVWICYNAAGGV